VNAHPGAAISSTLAALPHSTVSLVMHLVECSAPASAVSVAPLTALCDSHSVTVPLILRMPDGREIAGFWGLEDDAYYVRERSAEGDLWFTVVDDEPSIAEPAVSARSLPAMGARHATVMRVAYRTDDASRRPLIVGVYPAKSRGR
jgi:hypothetical protein